MEVYHVAKRSVSQSWTEHRNIVLFNAFSATALKGGRRTGDEIFVHFVGPVVHRFLVIYFLSQSSNERARAPNLASFLLLCKHRIEDWDEPIFKFAVVVVWNYKISDTVQTSPTQIRSVQVKISQIGLPETFYEVFFYTASGGHNSFDMLVFHEMENDFAQTRRD